MASANSKGKESEGSLFSVSVIPNITSEILNGKNYLAWSASVEVWFLGQGHYDHLEKSLDEISEEKRDLWKKVDYQLCASLWQSVEPHILKTLRAFKTCHTFWKKAQNVYGYDTQGFYESAKKLVALKQSHHDLSSYVSKAQSVVEELKTYMQADTLEEIKNKCDNLLMMMVLQGMHPNYEQYRRQILTSQELPSMENLFIRILQAPFPKPGSNSTDNIQSSANWSIQGNREGHGGGGCPQRSRCERMRFTQDACDSLPGLPEETTSDIPLPELQGWKTLKVAFHHATKDEVVIHTIRLPKQSTVGDVLDDLKTKVELSSPEAELRLLEVFYHKIYKVFTPNEKIENINDQYWTLRAEEIPEEEKNLGPHDRLIHVYHFTKDTAQNQMQIQNFGEPFFLVIREGETLTKIKVRIQKKLQVPYDEFAKWKFAFISLGRPEYLQDFDIVSSRFQRRDVYGAWEQYLGLEHTDNAPKRSYAVNQNRHTFEKPVKIYN